MTKATQSTKRQLEGLRKEIAIGSKQANRGQLVDGEAVFAAIRQRSAQRKGAKE